MTREYFNQMAATWDKITPERDATKLERMLQRLNLEPGSTVLDVGTGTGIFIPFLLSRIGNGGRLIALDIAEEMLTKARAKGFNGNIDYLCVDVTSIPLGDEIFDAIVCYASFPHFHDKTRALTEIKRVTKSSGKLLICHTSSRAKINQIHRGIPALQNDIIPDDSEMQVMLATAGFTDIRIEDDGESYLATASKPITALA